MWTLIWRMSQHLQLVFLLDETHQILISFNWKMSFNYKGTKNLSKNSVKKKFNVYIAHTIFFIQSVNKCVNSISLGYRTCCFCWVRSFIKNTEWNDCLRNAFSTYIYLFNLCLLISRNKIVLMKSDYKKIFSKNIFDWRGGALGAGRCRAWRGTGRWRGAHLTDRRWRDGGGATFSCPVLLWYRHPSSPTCLIILY